MLWFGQDAGDVTPSRVGKRCARAGDDELTSMAGRANASTPQRRLTASTAINQESTTVYAPSGRRRTDDPRYAADTSFLVEKLADRPAYTHTPWENAGKRILPPPQHEEKPRVMTPRKVGPPPFGTMAMDPATVPSPRRQKKHVDTHLASASVGEVKYVPKRSRTPPAFVAPRCATEGFCVLYSSRPMEGGLVQYMSMVERDGHGKSNARGEKDFIHNRKVAADKAEKTLEHKRELRRGRMDVDRPASRPTGLRRCQSPGVSAISVGGEGVFTLSAPYAVNLPGPRIDDVGMSSVRARWK
jgi:hypothetical protein